MRRFRHFSLRTLAALLGALIFAAVGYAMAASNTLPSGVAAGDGAGAITSYTLDTTTAPNTTTSLHVSLETNGDPTKILKVRFTIGVAAGTAAPQTVSAQFRTSTGTPIGSWYSSCTNTTGTTWECTTSGTAAQVQNGIQLRVVAAQ
ncbi:MAG TPA: hypothetical protein VFO07_08415 [Roseiflexaceae bacterium]|nr:hypothetical protein [Roseiflexaceae bacterium]